MSDLVSVKHRVRVSSLKEGQPSVPAYNIWHREGDCSLCKKPLMDHVLFWVGREGEPVVLYAAYSPNGMRCV